MMVTHFSFLTLFLFTLFLFPAGLSGAYIPERRADETANQNDNNNECDPDPNIEWEGTTCTPTHKKVIIEEFKTAISMTEQTRADLHKNGYDKDFFSHEVREQNDYQENALETYRRIGEMLKGTSDYKFKVTCDDRAKSCKKKNNQPPLQAYMRDTAKWKQGEKGTMNFCAAFFDDKPQHGQASIQSTQTRLSQCKNQEFTIREAQRSRASALIHECIHTRYAMRDGRAKGNVIPGKDYAYGFNACYLLPMGKFDRSKFPAMKKLTSNKALCPDEKNPDQDTWCDPDLSFQNPDSWSFIATGIYFSNECGKKIEYPERPKIPEGGC